MPLDQNRHSDPRFPQLGFILGSCIIDFLPIPFMAYALNHMGDVHSILAAIPPRWDVSDSEHPVELSAPDPPSDMLAKAAFGIGLAAAILGLLRTLVFLVMHMLNKPMPSASFFTTIPVLLLYIPMVGVGWNHSLYICDEDGDSCKNGVFDLVYTAWSGFNTGSPPDGVDKMATQTIYAGVIFVMFGFGWIIFVMLLVGSHYFRARNPHSPYHGHARLGSETNVETVPETKAAAPETKAVAPELAAE